MVYQFMVFALVISCWYFACQFAFLSSIGISVLHTLSGFIALGIDLSFLPWLIRISFLFRFMASYLKDLISYVFGRSSFYLLYLACLRVVVRYSESALGVSVLFHMHVMYVPMGSIALHKVTTPVSTSFCINMLFWGPYWYIPWVFIHFISMSCLSLGYNQRLFLSSWCLFYRFICFTWFSRFSSYRSVLIYLYIGVTSQTFTQYMQKASDKSYRLFVF